MLVKKLTLLIFSVFFIASCFAVEDEDERLSKIQARLRTTKMNLTSIRNQMGPTFWKAVSSSDRDEIESEIKRLSYELIELDSKLGQLNDTLSSDVRRQIMDESGK